MVCAIGCKDRIGQLNRGRIKRRHGQRVNVDIAVVALIELVGDGVGSLVQPRASCLTSTPAAPDIFIGQVRFTGAHVHDADLLTVNIDTAHGHMTGRIRPAQHQTVVSTFGDINAETDGITAPLGLLNKASSLISTVIRGRRKSRVGRVFRLVSVSRDGIGVHVGGDNRALPIGFLALTLKVVRQVSIRGLASPQFCVEVVGFGLSELRRSEAIDGIQANGLTGLLRRFVHQAGKSGLEVDGISVDVPRPLGIAQLVDMRPLKAQGDLLLILIDHVLTPLNVLRVHHVQGRVLLAGNHDACPRNASITLSSNRNGPIATDTVILISLKGCVAHRVRKRGNASLIPGGNELLDDIRGEVPLFPVAPLISNLVILIAHGLFVAPHPVVVLQ